MKILLYLIDSKLPTHFFVDAVSNLDIESFYPLNANDPSNKTIEDVIRKYKFHPSIRKIKENIKVESKFSFKDTTPVEFGNEILELDAKKASLDNDIPIKILKTLSDVSSKFLSEIYNDLKNQQGFPISKASERDSHSQNKPEISK